METMQHISQWIEVFPYGLLSLLLIMSPTNTQFYYKFYNTSIHRTLEWSRQMAAHIESGTAKGLFVIMREFFLSKVLGLYDNYLVSL